MGRAARERRDKKGFQGVFHCFVLTSFFFLEFLVFCCTLFLGGNLPLFGHD